MTCWPVIWLTFHKKIKKTGMKRLSVLLLFTILYGFLLAQNTASINDVRNIFDEKGDYYYDLDQHKKAIVYYNMAIKKNAENYYSVLRKAEAYEELELYPQAELCYQTIFKTDLRIDNIYRLRYAMVLLKNNKVKAYEYWMGQYNDVINSEISGKNYISTSENRIKLYKDTAIVKVAHVSRINTEVSESNPVPYDNQLIYSSTDVTNNSNYNINVATYRESGTLGVGSEFNSSLNSAKNDGPVSFFDINNTLYVTQSESLTKGLKAYTTSIPYEASEQLDLISFGFEGFTSIGHIAFNTNGTTMYFVSDDAGGKGGTDVYTSSMVNGEWSAPENMGGAVNTSGNELYPFVLFDTLLYFSSNGHNGQGGYDLYRVNLNGQNTPAENLGPQVNTASDEYALSFTPDGLTGYFSSNRPGGKGLEDIYRLHLLDLKIKYAGYRYQRKTNMQQDKINLYLSNGDEYNIGSDGNRGFNFGFLPEENYKMVIQHENATADNIVKNNLLTSDEKIAGMSQPEPLDKAEIPLEPGMKYQFTAGLDPISSSYKNELNNLGGQYQDPNTSTIDLTALAKELFFEEGEVYTIRFVRDKSRSSTAYKAKGESSIFIEDESVGIYGKAFFIVLPLEAEVNFNVQTDLEYLKENFNAKKYALVIDQGPVFQKVDMRQISMAVNTKDITEAGMENIYMAEEFSIIPSTEYILTLIKRNAATSKETEIIVPLTKDVKYNLGANQDQKEEYKKALAELVVGREDIEIKDEEIIDISILSKALEIEEGEEVALYLMPTKSLGKEQAPVMTSEVTLNGKELTISSDEKYTIIVPFSDGSTVNLNTDISYLEENFAPESYLLNIDTLGFFSEITVDTTGYGYMVADGKMLSMNVNAEEGDDVDIKNQLTAREVSIIPGKMYILTVSKVDGETGEESEIIVPLTKKVKYDFTTTPGAKDEYKVSLDKFLDKNEEIETIDGEVIDISLLSKELQIAPGDEVSFSLLPAKTFSKTATKDAGGISSLYLDNKVVEFTQIQKYTIKVPLSDKAMNIQTDVAYIEDKFEPGSYFVDVDTISFFPEITVDTTGYGDRVIQEEEITDPVFDVVTVNFGLNEHDLQNNAMQIIQEEVIDVLSKDRRLYVTIKGYTDALGNADYNMNLSRRRAQSVKNFLRENGIGQSRIRTFSFGASKSLETGVNWEDLSEEELKKHRKVEIVIYLPE